MLIFSFLRPAQVDRPYLPADAALATPASTCDNILSQRQAICVSYKAKFKPEVAYGRNLFLGRYVESDGTFLATALRETAEEVGIAFTIDQVIGRRSAGMATMTSKHFIVPFVTIQEMSGLNRGFQQVKWEEVIDVPLIETLKSIELF